ncbi:MAG: hypothetical protein MJ093_05400 [Saccharofermentans sp.]|nr:hypothetical protein [Saccharofermentans sp.]
MKLNKKTTIITIASAMVIAAIALGITLGSGINKNKSTKKNRHNVRADATNSLLPSNEDNIFGIKSVIEDNGNIILVFDNDMILENCDNGIYGFSVFYYNADDPEVMPCDSITLSYRNKKDGSILKEKMEYDNDTFTVQRTKTQTIITLRPSEADLDNLTSISFSNCGDYSEINLLSPCLYYITYGGDCSNEYTQYFEQNSKTWSEVESEFRVYEICEE